METRSSVDTPGPPVLDPHQLIPLGAFARVMDFNIPLYTTHELWEQVVRHGPYAVCGKLANVVSSALATKKADYASLDFIHRYDEEDGGKAKKVRLRATLYQTSEGVPWVMLNLGPLPVRFRAGRSND